MSPEDRVIREMRDFRNRYLLKGFDMIEAECEFEVLIEDMETAFENLRRAVITRFAPAIGYTDPLTYAEMEKKLVGLGDLKEQYDREVQKVVDRDILIVDMKQRIDALTEQNDKLALEKDVLEVERTYGSETW